MAFYAEFFFADPHLLLGHVTSETSREELKGECVEHMQATFIYQGGF